MLKKISIILTAIFLFLPSSFVSAWVIMPYANISGYVRSGGIGVADATVNAIYTQGYPSFVEDSTVTDENGFYSLSVWGGNYDIQVVADGYQTKTENINAPSWSQITLDFNLEPLATRKPVIIVPGILGSYLNRNDNNKTEVWLNTTKMAIPGDDSYLNELAMTDFGGPNLDNPLLLPTDIFRIVDDKDFFQGLISELENQGYQENIDLFVFPYDWRWPIEWTAGNESFPTILSLKEKIEEVQNQTGADKVDIVAHSMGGLVVKKYIHDFSSNAINKFIDIATPHLGSPDAFKTLMYGDNLGSGYLNILTIKNISQNFPSIYQLLPSRAYFNINDPDYQAYTADVYDIDNNGVRGDLNYDQTMEFLGNAGRNDYLLSTFNVNDQLHNQIDQLVLNNTYNIVGCGLPTLGKIYVLNKEKNNGKEYAVNVINGDGTVPLKSAEYLTADKTFFTSGIEHPYLPSTNGVKQLVASILKDEQNNFGFSQYTNLSSDDSICSFSATAVSFHSPISLHVYDENNNHLGPDVNGDIENNIDGAQYDIIDGNKFAFLPKGHTYRVEGEAEAVGSFNARIQNIENGEYIKTVYFNEVALLTASSTVQFAVSDNQTDYTLNEDQNNDGVFETQIQPSSILNQQEAADLIKPETVINLSGTQGNNGFYVSDIQITLTAQDGSTLLTTSNSGILKTEYSLDNGQTWQLYQEPFTLNQEGATTILYQSTDRAGNIEETKTQEVKIDKIAPIIDIFSPFDGQEALHSETLNLTFSSDAATGTINLYLDDQPLENTTTLDLFAYKLGEHSFKITASDEAGNVAEKKVDFMIVADIDSTISDIQRSYDEGMIKKDSIRKDLTKQLKDIQNYSEKYGERQTHRDAKFKQAMDKCINKKGQEWCENKLGRRFEKVTYRMEKIHQKALLKQYQEVLKDLETYKRKQLISERGYEIIRDDVEYLINTVQ